MVSWWPRFCSCEKFWSLGWDWLALVILVWWVIGTSSFEKKKKCIQQVVIPWLKKHSRIFLAIMDGLMLFSGVLIKEIPRKQCLLLSLYISIFLSLSWKWIYAYACLNQCPCFGFWSSCFLSKTAFFLPHLLTWTIMTLFFIFLIKFKKIKKASCFLLVLRKLYCSKGSRFW